ncbi:hypothetical protein [Pelagibacterium xiamenense]|uniref:hypothetical protein n=1 Tax=Pelagibacterium xiamenense TaxID=2901140 RepID=UPI001E4F00B6|nr:hypothetical protein [Pelagibacterium xiamenense]MCD7060205.1 hypothetical protein [Pelagibacterium xiamenense]
MTLARQIAGEAIKALAVLALIFLSFAHTPAQSSDFGDDGAYAVSAYSAVTYCGQGPEDDGAGHGPCHACRAGIADLPAPPCSADPAYSGFARIAFVHESENPVYEAADGPANPRAPPALV